jgi:hypothetical protein
MTKRIMRFPAPPLLMNPGTHFLRHEKAEALAEILETQFQPVTDSSVPVDIGTVDVALVSNIVAPASEHKLNNPEEVKEAIRGLKFRKAPGPNGNENGLKHLQQRALSILFLIFKSILHTHHYPRE